MRLVVVLGPLADRNDSVVNPLPWGPKKVPLSGGASLVGHFREYPRVSG